MIGLFLLLDLNFGTVQCLYRYSVGTLHHHLQMSSKNSSLSPCLSLTKKIACVVFRLCRITDSTVNKRIEWSNLEMRYIRKVFYYYYFTHDTISQTQSLTRVIQHNKITIAEVLIQWSVGKNRVPGLLDSYSYCVGGIWQLSKIASQETMFF